MATIPMKAPPNWFGTKEIPDKYQFDIEYFSREGYMEILTKTLPAKYHCLMNDAYKQMFPTDSKHLYEDLEIYAHILLKNGNISSGHFNRIDLIDYDKYNE